MPSIEKRLIKKMQIFHGFYNKEFKNTNVFSISNLGREIILKKLWDPSTKHTTLLPPTGMVWNPHLIDNETRVCTEL